MRVLTSFRSIVISAPRAVLIAAALAGALAGVPVAQTQGPQRSEAELRQLLNGAWYLVQSETEGNRRITAAIDRAVSEMNFFLQSVTRSQLQEKTPLNRRIDLGFDADTSITCVFDQRFTYRTMPGREQSFSLPDGATVAVNQFFRDGHLEQRFGHALGTRWNVFTLSADGQTMTIAATQQGPMMPVPVHFTLDYRQRR